MSISVSLMSAPGWYAVVGAKHIPVAFWEVSHYEKPGDAAGPDSDDEVWLSSFSEAVVCSRNAMIWSTVAQAFKSAVTETGFTDLIYEPTARQDRRISRDKVHAHLMAHGSATFMADLNAQMNRALMAIAGEDLADQMRESLEDRE